MTDNYGFFSDIGMGWIIGVPVLLIAMIWIVAKIRKRLNNQDFRKCTDVFFEEGYLKGELIKKNVPKRIIDK